MGSPIQRDIKQVCVCVYCSGAFSHLTWLVGHQQEHMACLTAEGASSFYNSYEPNFLKMYATNLHQIFRIGSNMVNMGTEDCCEIGLQSLKRCCHGNQFFFI